MKIHPFRLLSIILLFLLIGFMLGRLTVKAEVVETVKYITLTETEYITQYVEVEAVEEKVSLGEYNVSAYCSCSECCGKSDGITYSGTQATEGTTIAADLLIHPIGTVLYIEGLGLRTVEDKGGAIKGKKLDVYFASHESALSFGRQELEVWEVE